MTALLRYESSRRFRVWEFFVSHSQLLIRSAKRSDQDVNVDIVFRGVEYVSLPCFLNSEKGLTLQEGSESDLVSFEEFGSFTYPERRVFWLMLDDKRYTIIAAWCKVTETAYDPLESGLERSFS